MPNSPSGLGPASQKHFRKLGPEYPHIFLPPQPQPQPQQPHQLSSLLFVRFILWCFLPYIVCWYLFNHSVAFFPLITITHNRDEDSDSTPRKQGFDAHTIEYSTENKWILEGFGYCDTSKRGVAVEGDQSVGYD